VSHLAIVASIDPSADVINGFSEKRCARLLKFPDFRFVKAMLRHKIIGSQIPTFLAQP
jgi:hypothetical protein